MFLWQLSSPDSFFLDLLATLAGQTSRYLLCEPCTDEKTEWEAAVQMPLLPTSVQAPIGLQISAHVGSVGAKKRSHSLGESLRREGKGLEKPGWHSGAWAEARDHLRQVGLGNSVPGLFPSILLLGASFYPKASLPVDPLNWDRSEGWSINASTFRLPESAWNRHSLVCACCSQTMSLQMPWTVTHCCTLPPSTVPFHPLYSLPLLSLSCLSPSFVPFLSPWDRFCFCREQR